MCHTFKLDSILYCCLFLMFSLFLTVPDLNWQVVIPFGLHFTVLRNNFVTILRKKFVKKSSLRKKFSAVTHPQRLRRASAQDEIIFRIKTTFCVHIFCCFVIFLLQTFKWVLDSEEVYLHDWFHLIQCTCLLFQIKHIQCVIIFEISITKSSPKVS